MKKVTKIIRAGSEVTVVVNEDGNISVHNADASMTSEEIRAQFETPVEEENAGSGSNSTNGDKSNNEAGKGATDSEGGKEANYDPFKDMTIEQLREKAKELGCANWHNSGAEKLKAAIIEKTGAEK